MELEEIIKEFGIEIAIEKITPKIKEKIDEYTKTKDENVKKELAELLEDRDNIYSNNEEVIRKYVEE